MTVASGLSGCTTVRYLFQATQGQLQLSNRARPIEEVLKDPTTPPKIKKLLSEIPSIKSFGEEHGLKPTKNYSEYVKLDRPAAVWVVSACDPLKFEPKEWSFPIVGSFTYLGWFDLENAVDYGKDLEKKGFDVDVRGARAYSTLGWFKDAVLSTMIPEGDEALGDLVNVVLHESVHATLYIQGQSYFNESVASFVADKLTPDYLVKTRGKDSREYEAYMKAEKDREKRNAEFRRAYFDLEKLYASDRAESEKLDEKNRILGDLKTKLGVKKDINNATLIQFRTYGVGQPEFSALLRSCRRDWPRFWSVLHALKSESFSEKQQESIASVILPMAREGCQQPSQSDD